MKLSSWMKVIAVAVMLMFGGLLLGAQPASADAVYDKNCAKCHGADGKAATTMGKKMKIRDWTSADYKADPAAIEKAIKDGVAKTADRGKMSAYGDKLSDAEIKALVKVVQGFKK